MEVLKKSRRTGEHNELNLTGRYSQLKERGSHESCWSPREDECNVCLHSAELSKPGRKRSHIGRSHEKEHNLLFTATDVDIFSDFFDSSVPESRLNDCHLPMPEHKQCHFICSVCQEIMAILSVFTGCHYFCVRCLSDMFKTARQNTVPCPESRKSIPFHKVTSSGTTFQGILLN